MKPVAVHSGSRLLAPGFYFFITRPLLSMRPKLN
jgi:hypothetical protein